eukprot:2953243-Amphidinium_carterae.1
MLRKAGGVLGAPEGAKHMTDASNDGEHLDERTCHEDLYSFLKLALDTYSLHVSHVSREAALQVLLHTHTSVR